MAVATFLASANFIALMELVIGQRKVLSEPEPLVPAACKACKWLLAFDAPWYLIWLSLLSHLSTAGLFITAVYLYDRLSMPVGFWVMKKPNWIEYDDGDAEERLLIHGYPQAYILPTGSID